MRASAKTGVPPDRPILSVRGLVKHYPVGAGLLQRRHGVVHAVENVSFDIRKGETLGLVGESGSGKSTIGRMIVRLEEPTAGEIWLGDTNIAHLPESRLRGMRALVQMIFQDPYSSLDPRFTAEALI